MMVAQSAPKPTGIEFDAAGDPARYKKFHFTVWCSYLMSRMVVSARETLAPSGRITKSFGPGQPAGSSAGGKHSFLEEPALLSLPQFVSL
jgi:hypothetical protein